MNIITDVLCSNEFQLIKRDVRALKKHILSDENEDKWRKAIILFNFYLFFYHLYILYELTVQFKESSNFGYIYMYFFVLCNTRNLYLHMILNISKLDKPLAESMFQNTKQYFV